MPVPKVIESNERRLAYRPWKVSSALIFLAAGIVLLVGGFLWAQINDRTMQSMALPLIPGIALTVYGLIYSYKNAQQIIFDLTSGRVAKKSPWLAEKELSRFNEIYAISTVSEMNTFQYVLTRKSQYGSGDIAVSDSFYSNKMNADRQAFETQILPVIERMLNLKSN